jgi:uncharacterized protein YlxW (UPF0749 family)
MITLLGGLSGMIRIAVGAVAAGILAYAITYLIIVPLERADARRGYVILAEKTALASQLAEERRQRLAGAQALEEHRKRLAVSLASEDQANARLEKEIAENEKAVDAAGRACRADDADLDFFMRKP